MINYGIGGSGNERGAFPVTASNQYFSHMPTIGPNPLSGLGVPQPKSQFNQWGPGTSYAGSGQPTYLGHGVAVEGTMDPTITSQMEGYLQGQVGQGVKAFNLPTTMPWGGKTVAGQLNAPLNPVFQELLKGFTTGNFQGMPGMGTLENVAENGISAVPTWQTMVDAAQRGIGEGAANLKEQMAFGGNLAGSPFGTSMSDYYGQTEKDLNSILANMQYQGIQDQLGAASTIAGMGENFGSTLQNLGQQDIQNLYNEFIRTQPQYNPLLPYEQSIATTFPPMYNVNKGTGILGAMIPGLMSGGAAGIGAAAGGAGTIGSILAGLAAI
jgi:hypothetical protein